MLSVFISVSESCVSVCRSNWQSGLRVVTSEGAAATAAAATSVGAAAGEVAAATEASTGVAEDLLVGATGTAVTGRRVEAEVRGCRGGGGAAGKGSLGCLIRGLDIGR